MASQGFTSAPQMKAGGNNEQALEVLLPDELGKRQRFAQGSQFSYLDQKTLRLLAIHVDKKMPLLRRCFLYQLAEPSIMFKAKA